MDSFKSSRASQRHSYRHQPEMTCLHLPVLCCPTGGRTGEAIVDAALSALRQLVKDRLGGRSGGYSSGKQVRLLFQCVLLSAWICVFLIESVV